MVRKLRAVQNLRFACLSGAILALNSGCGLVPRSRMDECQRLSQTLRMENARLKDRVVALQGQNRDYAERAVDDSRRLTEQDKAIEQLERSVQGYQEDRNRLEAAFAQVSSSLGGANARPSGAPLSARPRPDRSTELSPAWSARRSKSIADSKDEETDR